MQAARDKIGAIGAKIHALAPALRDYYQPRFSCDSPYVSLIPEEHKLEVQALDVEYHQAQLTMWTEMNEPTVSPPNRAAFVTAITNELAGDIKHCAGPVGLIISDKTPTIKADHKSEPFTIFRFDDRVGLYGYESIIKSGVLVDLHWRYNYPPVIGLAMIKSLIGVNSIKDLTGVELRSNPSDSH